jgi:hypothetical protein
MRKIRKIKKTFKKKYMKRKIYKKRPKLNFRKKVVKVIRNLAEKKYTDTAVLYYDYAVYA